jgi:hypothetical protein
MNKDWHGGKWSFEESKASKAHMEFKAKASGGLDMNHNSQFNQAKALEAYCMI